MRVTHALALCCAAAIFASCSKPAPPQAAATKEEKPHQYFHVAPETAGTISGTIKFSGKKPRRVPIDMSGDPACVEAHHGAAYDESLVVNPNGTLSNVFVYIKTGLEGKEFEIPATAAAIDQRGCAFVPRVLGIQAGQAMEITNSDPVTHNIHPLAQVNREWNHSEGAGEPPITRRFPRPEVMIRVKCNIHSWMRAFIGVVAHPYYAVTGADGTFEIRNVPPGDYGIEVWHETLGVEDRNITVTPSGKVEAVFTLKGE